VRADRALCFPAPPRTSGVDGRLVRHDPGFALADPTTQPAPAVATTTATSRYGTARAASGDRLRPRPERRGGWADHPGELPIVKGTLIRLQVEHLLGWRAATPVWLWSVRTSRRAARA